MADANRQHGFEIEYFEAALDPTTVALAGGADAICLFVNDRCDAEVVHELADLDVRLVLMRCTGVNNVDLDAARQRGLCVANVPAYSPYAVAEHTVAILLCLIRKIHKSYNRVREGNFSLDGLVGFDLHGKTVGVIGYGAIGRVLCGILGGFGCRVLVYDPFAKSVTPPAAACDLDTLWREADIVSLHCPLTPDTHHLVDAAALDRMKDGVILINTSRGGLIESSSVIEALKSRKLGGLAIDVYEEESGLFFSDHSSDIILDDRFERLMTFPNVVVTGHQAFLTREALRTIAETTLNSAAEFAAGDTIRHRLTG
ncbi:2-hydroxyacid dehydrogenase [uncultured Abyssibacter sp.]|uniref:2-hydroxyacid dehydrogenase n=1 Tax=uncultured Abyssibacter sp. TaxID=2320202 RepID=UPI0032B2E954